MKLGRRVEVLQQFFAFDTKQNASRTTWPKLPRSELDLQLGEINLYLPFELDLCLFRVNRLLGIQLIDNMYPKFVST
jgi:hypothetical protein